MLKQGVKTINADFIWTFFQPVQTLCNLIPGASSFSDAKK